MVKELVNLKDGKGEIDDIDNLGNRRVRSVGELLENQYRVGLLRMERAVKERMSSVDVSTVMPNDLINAKPAVAAVREFFGSVAALAVHGPDQPAVRSHAQAPRFGARAGRSDPRARRLRSPRRSPDALWPHLPDRNAGRPEHRSDQLALHLRAASTSMASSKRRTARSSTARSPPTWSIFRRWKSRSTRSPRLRPKLNADGSFVEELVSARQNGEFVMAPREPVTLMDVSPKQLVSVAASLIPFLENDDANRALMGSNMQRQAVPLVQAEAPFVGTGMEGTVARDSGAAIAALRGGIVDQVDATRIVIRATGDIEPGQSGVDIYTLQKFQRSNQNTCINQRPLVKVGDVIERATSSPTAPRPNSANWRWAATASSRSCRGTATTTKIRS